MYRNKWDNKAPRVSRFPRCLPRDPPLHVPLRLVSVRSVVPARRFRCLSSRLHSASKRTRKRQNDIMQGRVCQGTVG
jgi:hypothetical protein